MGEQGKAGLVENGARLVAADWVMQAKTRRNSVRISASFQKGQAVDVFGVLDRMMLIVLGLGGGGLPVEQSQMKFKATHGERQQ